MAQWGRNDQAVTANATTTAETSNGAPIGTYTAVKLGGGANAHFGNTSPKSRANVDVAMFNNTTPSAFLSGQAVGVFGADTTEVAVSNAAGIAHAGWKFAAQALVQSLVVFIQIVAPDTIMQIFLLLSLQ